MRDVKQSAMAFVAHFVQYYIYEYYILETTRFNIYSIVYPTCALVVCCVLSPDVMIVLGAGYMLLCSKILHIQYFEFLLMYPFVWSIIHNVNIPTDYYLPIISIKHVSYALQYLTPRSIHTKVGATLCGGLYVAYDQLLKLKNDSFKPEAPHRIIVMNVIVDTCFVILWKPYEVASSTISDGVACLVVVIVHKLPIPMYAKIALNAVAYVSKFAHEEPLPYMQSINRCVTLSIKEELYHAYNTESHIRYVEHFSGFIIGYLFLYFNVYPMTMYICSVVVMCASLCVILFMNRSNEKSECRCARTTSV